MIDLWFKFKCHFGENMFHLMQEKCHYCDKQYVSKVFLLTKDIVYTNSIIGRSLQHICIVLTEILLKQ